MEIDMEVVVKEAQHRTALTQAQSGDWSMATTKRLKEQFTRDIIEELQEKSDE